MSKGVFPTTLNNGTTPTALSITGQSNMQFTAAVTPATSAVTEPATWAIMFMGFGMVGFGLRRRSNVKTTVSYA